jgi:hypothetical protein
MSSYGNKVLGVLRTRQLVGQVNAFLIQVPELGLGLRPPKRPIAIAGTKSAPVARKRASASDKVKIPGSLAFSIPRAGFFKPRF